MPSQAQLDKIAELKAARTDAERRVAELEDEIFILERGCDHTFPNGETAIEGGFLFSHCKLCYWNDM